MRAAAGERAAPGDADGRRRPVPRRAEHDRAEVEVLDPGQRQRLDDLRGRRWRSGCRADGERRRGVSAARQRSPRATSCEDICSCSYSPLVSLAAADAIRSSVAPPLTLTAYGFPQGMVNAALGSSDRCRMRRSLIFDGDRKVAAIIAVGIAGDVQPAAEAEGQVARRIEPRQRRAGRCVTSSNAICAAAQRIQLDPRGRSTRTGRPARRGRSRFRPSRAGRFGDRALAPSSTRRAE